MSECDMIHDMVDIQRTPVYPGGVNRAYLIAVIASPALPLESNFFFQCQLERSCCYSSI